MSAADSIRTFIAPLLPGWRIQFGAWRDGNTSHRYAVIKPAGGLPVSLLREPQFTLNLIGSIDESSEAITAAAETIIEAMRVSSGDLVFMQPGEPVFMATNDGRPVLELAISAITT